MFIGHIQTLGAVMLTSLAVSSTVWADDIRDLQGAYERQIRPLLAQYCGDCHGSDESTAGLNLDRFRTVDQLLENVKIWRGVMTRVRRGQMPPEDSPALPEADKKRIVTWLENALDSLDCTNVNPGNVTLRRLNRTEYRNTIRSLTGIDYILARDFPGDDVGYNFDNIADVLSLPPLLLERYLDAANQITDLAIVEPGSFLLDRKLAPSQFRDSGRSRTELNDGARLFFTEARIQTELKLPLAGRYRVIVTAYADQAGDEAAKIELDLAKASLGVRGVEGERYEPQQIEYEFDVDEDGEIQLGIAFTNDYYVARAIGRQDRNLYVTGVSVQGPIDRNDALKWFQFASDLDVLATQLEQAEAFLREFAGRAYRRPIKDDEVRRLVGLFKQALTQTNGEFFPALRIPVQAVLVSPHFLFKVEMPVDAGQTRKLNSFELATSLAYFLWSDMPDEQLRELAGKQELMLPQVYQREARRLLNDPRSEALVKNFVTQWLQLRSLADMTPDPELFPGVDDQVLADMVRETELMISDVIRRDGSILEFLSADFTYLNQRLAKHYQLPVSLGDEFSRVDLEPFRRSGGLLTQASILTLSSNPTRTSPVKRGKWVMENLLGREPPPPLPEVVPLDDQQELTGTLRQRLEQHRQDPNCAACHHTMDALGFAMENYDAVGRRRLLDDGLPVDATSELPDGTRLNGIEGLQKALQANLRQEFMQCVTEKMLIYALGRGLHYYDQCAIDKILDRLARNDYRFSELVLAVVESDPFQNRRGRPR